MADKADSAMQYVNGLRCSAVQLIFKILDFIKQQVEACIPPAVATIPKDEDAVLSSEVVNELTEKVLDHDGRPRLLPWVSVMESVQFAYEGVVGSLPLEQIGKKVSESPELLWGESAITSGVVNLAAQPGAHSCRSCSVPGLAEEVRRELRPGGSNTAGQRR